jgi:hypothetical protein
VGTAFLGVWGGGGVERVLIPQVCTRAAFGRVRLLVIVQFGAAVSRLPFTPCLAEVLPLVSVAWHQPTCFLSPSSQTCDPGAGSTTFLG